jgi:hypothetical protein
MRNQSISNNKTKTIKNKSFIEDKENLKDYTNLRREVKLEEKKEIIIKKVSLVKISQEHTPVLGLKKNFQEETDERLRSKQAQIKNKDSNIQYEHKDESDSLIENFFVKRPKHKVCISDYFKVDHWNLKECFLHPLIPYSKRNSDEYKIMVCNNYLRQPEKNFFKTQPKLNITTASRHEVFDPEKHRPQKRKFSELSFCKVNANDNTFLRRKVSSCKKIYESFLYFTDENKQSHVFKVYEDVSIGFDCRFNQVLKEQEMDNDIYTDEEQLRLAKLHTLDHLRNEIENFNTKNLKNKMRFKRSRSCNLK